MPASATRSAASNEGRNGAAGSQPLVSVCISAYNVERFLADALRSVLDQTHRNLEVIVVDNGSVDRTFDVARSFADPRLRSFRLPENIGGYQAMNMVAAMATGDYVAIYHSDDVYEPTIIEKELARLDADHELGAVFAMFHFIDESGRIYGGVDLPPELASRARLSDREVFPFVLRHGNFIFACPTFMVRRSVLSDVGFFDADKWDIAADLEMWLRIVRRYPVAILNERLLRYRTTEQQWTHRWKRLRTEPDRAIDVLEEFLEHGDWRTRLEAADLAELRYKRCDDETTRAANALIKDQAALARTLLKGRFPAPALFSNFKRRKLRVLLLRGVMKAGLTAGATGGLKRLLLATEYGQWR